MNEALAKATRALIAAATVVAAAASHAADTRVQIGSNIGGGTVEVINPTETLQRANSYIYGDTFARASASFGTLRAEARANALVTFSLPAASAQARFADTLTISSPGLNGQSGFVDIGVDYNWDPSIAAAGYAITGDIALGFGGLSAVARESRSQFIGDPVTDQSYAIQTFGAPATVLGAVLGDFFSVRIPFTFGTSYNLSMLLAVQAQAQGGSVEMDAFNSAYWDGLRVYDSQLRPVDFSVQSESGTNYAVSFAPSEAKVPLPGSLALMAAGLLMVAPISRRAHRGGLARWRNGTA